MPMLFEDVSVPFLRQSGGGKKQAILGAILGGFPRSSMALARTGYSGTRRRITMTELLRRWLSGRSIVNVTDLHIRGTRFERLVDTSSLSDFNLLINKSREISEEEMLTMVVSTAGAVTDSHTDDPDGSNHCFLGQKLWLVWDTFAGLSGGLEDVERSSVGSRRARFDLDTFLSIRSSRWFIIGENQTLFLPGNFAHKVVTLENYFGVGSFFVMLPSYLRNLSGGRSTNLYGYYNLAMVRRMIWLTK